MRETVSLTALLHYGADPFLRVAGEQRTILISTNPGKNCLLCGCKSHYKTICQHILGVAGYKHRSTACRDYSTFSLKHPQQCGRFQLPEIRLTLTRKNIRDTPAFTLNNDMI
ncbi:hypothetical protein D3C75_1059010 [compost metagenome]